MSDEVKYQDHTVTITGIPVGTRYTIEEETPKDESRLQSVTVPPNCHSAQEIGNTMVEGVIVASEDPELTAIFTNTTRKLINIEFDKLWKDAMVRTILALRSGRDKSTSSSSAAWQPAQTMKTGNR